MRALPTWIRTTPHALFSLLTPDECRLCRSALRSWSAAPVCKDCWDSLQPFSPDFFCARCRTPFWNRYALDAAGCCALCRLGVRGYAEAYSFGAYEGPLRELVHLLKFGQMRPLAAKLGALVHRAVPLDQSYDLVVPVPLHWTRRWRRGFNQAELLAREVARRRGLPCVNGLARIRATPAQAGLTAAQRRRNLAGTIHPRPGFRCEGQRVLLIDDVLTTGSTLSACAGALLRAGARRVSVAALARADRRPPAASPQFSHPGASRQ